MPDSVREHGMSTVIAADLERCLLRMEQVVNARRPLSIGTESIPGRWLGRDFQANRWR